MFFRYTVKKIANYTYYHLYIFFINKRFIVYVRLNVPKIRHFGTLYATGYSLQWRHSNN